MVASADNDNESGELLLHAYADGELDVANGVALMQRIEAEPALGARLNEICALQSAMRTNFAHKPLPPHLTERIERLHRGRRIHPTWSSMAAAIIVATALSSTMTWLSFPSNALTSQLVDGHLRSLASQTTDVASSDRHTVKPWFNGKVSLSPLVKDLAAEGFPLAGGRIDVLYTTPVPTLVYNRRRHVISVTAAPFTNGGLSEGAINGFNVLRWSANGVSYWAISDLNSAELGEFVRLYRQP
jgi:anti-sigma factor RsiW